MRKKVINEEKEERFIKDGMIVGMRGFKREGDEKEVKVEMEEREEKDKLKIKMIKGE